MAVYLSPVGGVAAQFLSNSGAVLSGGKLYTYAAGTTTPLASYTSSTGNVNQTNPIIFDAAGRVPGGEIWISSQPYKFVLKDSTDVLIATYDNISGVNATNFQVQDFTGTGSQTSFTFSTAPLGKNSTFVYVSGVYQNKDSYSVSGTTLSFSTAPASASVIEVMFN